MSLGRPIPELIVTVDERETLDRWTRRPTTVFVFPSAQSKMNRARCARA